VRIEFSGSAGLVYKAGIFKETATNCHRGEKIGGFGTSRAGSMVDSNAGKWV
jgi:hypothetical protein